MSAAVLNNRSIVRVMECINVHRCINNVWGGGFKRHSRYVGKHHEQPQELASLSIVLWPEGSTMF